MQILSADRTREGLVIALDDGKTGLYPAHVLYDIWFTLQRVIEEGPEELEENAV
jgi:hypothetical protein